ncbi:recombinase family protein [Histophilus somni]|uniref:recombinase family protein n=1 Tax=Histophilus somni TaxID=731 RepID=UPI00201E776A|nr:recombinase family protein [Histophilus somni]
MDYSYNSIDYKDKKLSWTNGTVTDILMNENYTGTYIFNMQPKTEVGGKKSRFLPKEEWERVPNNHEPIISIEDFNKVEKLKKKNQFMETKSYDFEWYKKSPLQSFVRCHHCGHILTCQKTRRKKNDGSLYEVTYFRCRICPQRGDASNNIRADKLEKIVSDVLKQKFEYNNEFIEDKTDSEDINSKISKLENKKDSYYEKFKLGKISIEKFIEIKKEYDTELEFLKEKLMKQNDEKKVNKNYKELSRGFISEHIDSIYVNDGEIVEIKYKN